MNYTKKWILSFILLSLLSLIAIFFLKDGLNGFRYGLDLNGWVTLKYLVDYSDYAKIYSGDDLFRQKKEAENIIMKTMNNRISALWVSDANVYSQAMNWQEYIIVDIGGSNTPEAQKQAIDSIWKTVQIEFKTQASTGWDEKVVAERKKQIDNIALSAVTNTWENFFRSLWEWKEWDSIMYNSWSYSDMELPTEVAANLTGLVAKWMWWVSLPISWSIAVSTGEIQPTWSVIKYNWQKDIVSTWLTAVDVLTYAYKNNIDVGSGTLTLSSPLSWDVFASWNNLFASVWQTFTGQNAYNIVWYKISSASWDLINNIKKELETKNLVSTWVYSGIPTVDGWYGSTELSQINNLTWTKWIFTSVSSWDTYVYKILDSKNSNQYFYSYFTIPTDSPASLIEKLKKKTYYNIEQITMLQNPIWVTALDSQGRALNAQYFKLAQVSQSQTGEPSVSIQFDEVWKGIFADISRLNIWKPVAIFVWGKMVVAPTIQEEIKDWVAQITGKYTADEAKNLVNDLNEWALPAKLTLANQDNISPALGQWALWKALLAWVVALAAISIFFFIVYGPYYGLVATLAMIAFTLVVLAVAKMLNYVFSLSWIAAMILSIGMAVDANVLMFERIKEELAGGKNTDHAIEDGSHRSYSAIRDWNLTNIIIWVLLFMLWTNVFKGFGLMVVLNVLVTLWVLVPLSKALMHDILPKVQARTNQIKNNKK